jgi:hypothetical protein
MLAPACLAIAVVLLLLEQKSLVALTVPEITRCDCSERDPSLHERNRAVVVAVMTVGVMKMPLNEVVDVVSVRNGFVPAARSVPVLHGVAAALMARGAVARIRGPDLDDAFVEVIVVLPVQMPIVQVVYVPVVFHRRVTAFLAVFVIMMLVRRVLHLVDQRALLASRRQ